jgi:hypothetical protein
MAFALAGALVSGCSELPSAMQDPSPNAHPIMGKLKIEMVGYVTAQTVSGVAVSRSGRLFVSLMQPGTNVSTSIGEIYRGVVRPYPIVVPESLRSGGGLVDQSTYALESVQAIAIDHHNHLWVLDCRTAPAGGPRSEPGALIEINLNDNKADRIISLHSMTDFCALDLRTRECSRISSKASGSFDHPCARGILQHQEPNTANRAADFHAGAMHCPNAAIWMDSGGRLYTAVGRTRSAPGLDRIRTRFRLIEESGRVHQPAGFGPTADGTLYVSANQVCQDSTARGDVVPSAVFKISSDMLDIVASGH